MAFVNSLVVQVVAWGRSRVAEGIQDRREMSVPGGYRKTDVLY